MDLIFMTAAAKVENRWDLLFGKHRYDNCPPARSPFHSYAHLIYDKMKRVKEIERKVAQREEEKELENRRVRAPPKDLYIHDEYHPTGVPQCVIRKTFSETCLTHPQANISEMINSDVAYLQQQQKVVISFSRPKNIRDVLCPSAYTSEPGKPASSYICEG